MAEAETLVSKSALIGPSFGHSGDRYTIESTATRREFIGIEQHKVGMTNPATQSSMRLPYSVPNTLLAFIAVTLEACHQRWMVVLWTSITSKYRSSLHSIEPHL